jgi:bacterioferritin
MQGDPQVIEILNEVLTNELTAVNQYFLHSRMQKNWGFTKLADYTYAESIDEMKHADVLIERILFLEGHPNVQRLDPVRIGENVPEQLASDLAVEVHAMDALRRGIVICSEKADTVTRLLLEDILRS